MRPRKNATDEKISAGDGGTLFIVPAELAALLSAPNTKKGSLQRALLALLHEHRDDDALPTSNRFCFYELEERGVVAKRDRSLGGRAAGQDVAEATLWLRDADLVAWSWIVDETRSVDVYAYAATVMDYLIDAVEDARIDCWAGAPPPLILCESRDLAGVLRSLASEYLTPIAGTAGQAGGFLVTDVAPLLNHTDRRVLYLGDRDRSGSDIEENTRAYIARHAPDWTGEWERLAITHEQVAALGLEYRPKRDGRDGRWHDAIETEALGQSQLVAILRARLDALLPEPLDRVRVREREQRDAMRAILDATR